jgi:redox-regulated HSP33 family molecular chaperone
MNAKVFRSRDLVIKTVSKCGRFRLSVCSATNLVNEILSRMPIIRSASTPGVGSSSTIPSHLPGGVELFATSTVFANVMASMLEREERLRLMVLSPTYRCETESIALGECRGSFNLMDVDPTAATSNAGESAESEEFLPPRAVIVQAHRVLYNHAQPVTSTTAVSLPADEEEGYINSEDDRAHWNFSPHADHFLRQSDGVPSASLLLSAVRPTTDPEFSKKPVLWCGGLLLQAIADDSSEVLDIITQRQGLYGGLWSRKPSRLLPGVELLHSLPSPKDSEGESSFGELFTRLHRRQTDQMVLLHDLLELGMFTSPSSDIIQKCRINANSDTSGSDTLLKGLPFAADQRSLQFSDSDVTRHAIDFACRCSKEDFLREIRALGKETCEKQLAKADPTTTLRCRTCLKEWTITAADWSAAMEASSSTGSAPQ